MLEVRSLLVAGACAIPACSLLAPTQAELSSEHGKSIDASDSGSTTDAASEDAVVPDACAGSKTCGGQCVALDDPAYGCALSGCEPCSLERASAKCESAACGIDQCESGYLDVNRTAADGCELASPIPTEGLVLWLMADDGVEESAGKVLSWKDRSPKRHDHSQPNATIRPTLVPGVLNGKPVIEFQAQRLENGAFTETFENGFSLFAIIERDASTHPQHTWGAILDLFDNDQTSGLYFARHGASDDFIASYSHTLAKLRTTDGSYAPGAPHLAAVSVGPSGHSLRWNGQVPALEATEFTPRVLKLERSYLGGTGSTMEFHTGWLAEIILYDRTLADASAVEQYLASKWSCCP